MSHVQTRTFEILLAEDEAAEVELVRQATRKFKASVNLHVVENGLELINFLKKEDRFHRAPTPDLVLLDLSMPVLRGLEALEMIRAEDSFKHIPIIVMSSTGKDEEVLMAYKLHANCFLQKPMRISEFDRLMENIESFWLSTARLPSQVG
jgi:two-component system response regulator